MTSPSRPHRTKQSPSRLPEEFCDLPLLMLRIESLIDRFAATLPVSQRRMMPNAMLNRAVNQMIRAEGKERAATILFRLSELVADGSEPCGQDAFPLTRQDA